MSLFQRVIFFSGLICLSQTEAAWAQLEFEGPPIEYSKAAPVDPVSQLQAKIDAGSVELQFEEKGGYLASVLEQLEIPQSSQMLVFSKTSLQLRRISPQRPRAIYFNDESYIGWVQGGDVIEISTVDPQLGAVFYSLSVDEDPKPTFLRDQGQCITCHATSRTEGVPGHLMRSVFADRTGQPHYGSGTYSTTQSSPFEKRWGGWYVTGKHGDLRHMGNLISQKNDRLQDLDCEVGANLDSLNNLVSTDPYLQPTSDIVPLLVLAHQLEMHNLLTRGNFEARSATHYDGVMNRALERDEDYVSDSTTRRVSSIGDKILRCLLFADEVPLTSPVQGISTYEEDFEALGIRDQEGRSLRDFDLESRMFKYPCSYLICSAAFDDLPVMMKKYVSENLQTILKGDPSQDEFKNLSVTDRKNIYKILQETKPGLLEASPSEELSGTK
ncbi:hypothetical protein OAF98_05980 [Planctomicrobium sp.]|nr:hypothetical protein [Planctomicrobium sp.]MDB4744018.1 hypothetical protein [Planctomicrobium sp.]